MPEFNLEITPETLVTVDAWYWAYSNKIQLQSGQFKLENHEYLIDPMQSEARVKVAKKGAQLGWTEANVLSTLHGQIHGRYPTGVLYLFPTGDDVSDFSKARFNPLIKDNYAAVGRYVQSTDSTNIKRIGTGMLYLRGAKATQKVENLKKDTSKLRSIPVDKVVFDEVDLMDPDMVQMALERFAHSLIQEESYLSTPTIPDFGIDKRYQESDQRIWVIKCPQCGRDCCLELDFPECVKFKGGKAYRACVKCGAELGPNNGKWVRQYPEGDVAGWWISQLNSFYVDPGRILELYNDPPNGNIGEVYNSKLGMAYIAAENRLVLNDVYSCCGHSPMAGRQYGPCAMGVDVGKNLHVVIGKINKDHLPEIVWFNEIPDFEELYRLSKEFNVKKCVMDYEPETHKAREFRNNAGYPVYLADYQRKVDQDDGQNMSELTGIIKVSRNDICDKTHAEFKNGRYVLPRRNPKVEVFAKQVTNLVRVLVEDKDRGTKQYKYIKLGQDHYRHATNYFEMAVRGMAMASEDSGDHLIRRMKQIMPAQEESPLTQGLEGGGDSVWS